MPLECVALTPRWEGGLAELFRALVGAGAATEFHPHPLTAEEAARRCRYDGRDLFYVMVDENRVLAYGMLRGWDEGYTVPSLGIAVHPEEQGRGLGRAFMHFLHVAARRRGAERVRLKVYPRNTRALALYRDLGYRFDTYEGGQLVGTLEL
jgi:ribosomal protein S18 acetylase RimI-like enzyme